MKLVLGKRPFINIVGKGENTDNQDFLLFKQCLLACQRPIKISEKMSYVLFGQVCYRHFGQSKAFSDANIDTA